MEPLESVDLESRAVTKQAARGHADLVEQVVGLRPGGRPPRGRWG